MLAETGVEAVSYATLKRHLPAYAEDGFRQKLAAACAAHAELGPTSLVLYDVSTLYFETDAADGFREPGYSKERRLEPQITIGLLTDAAGFPLMVEAFEGNRAETTTMLPTITAFMAAHRLPDVTIVADAGMISAANMKAIEEAGLSFILGMRIPDPLRGGPVAARAPRRADARRADPHPALAGRARRQTSRSDHVLPVQDRPGPTDAARDRRAGRQSRESGRGEGAGQAQPVHQARRREQVGHRALEAKARALAGIKGYITNLPDPSAEFVIGAYHRLYEIEASFRMSKHDLAARPIYHHKRESIDAHLTIVFAALAIGRLIEDRTGWSIRKFVRTARRYRTVHICAAGQLLTAEDPLPADLRETLALINKPASAHQLEPSREWWKPDP